MPIFLSSNFLIHNFYHENNTQWKDEYKILSNTIESIFFFKTGQSTWSTCSSFMLQMIQKTCDFYSDKTNWEVARSSIQCLTLHIQYAWTLFSTKAGTEADMHVQTVTAGYSGLQDVQMTNGKRKLCVAEALDKKDSSVFLVKENSSCKGKMRKIN